MSHLVTQDLSGLSPDSEDTLTDVLQVILSIWLTGMRFEDGHEGNPVHRDPRKLNKTSAEECLEP